MTTVGVDTRLHNRPLVQSVPMYAYQTPELRRVQLTSVKEGIFHPRLPTLRQLERHELLQKLPEEHCRTSIPRDIDNFKRASQDGRQTYSQGLQKNIRYEYSPDELKKTRDEWSKFLNRSPERYRIELTEHPQTANSPFTGYAVRYLRPDVTAAWRYTLREDPSLDQYGRQPTSANILGRYRDSKPLFGRSAPVHPWR